MLKMMTVDSTACSAFFKDPHPILTAIAVVTVGLFIAKIAFRILKFIWSHLRGPTVKFSQLGEYAVITGSTDGIGKAYALELARQGMNLVLISRSQWRLEATAKEVAARSPNTKIKTISANFETTQGIYERIESELTSLDIGMLVNNVGTTLDKKLMTPIDAYTSSEILAYMNVNAIAVVQMSRIVLPAMISKRRGVIINVSSGVALFPPLMSIYSTTKFFSRSFSNMLRLQYQKYGIIVQDVMPFIVDTKMATEAINKFPRYRWSVVPADSFVRQALRTVGRYSETCGAIIHDIIGAVGQASPDPSWLVQKTVDI